MDTLSSEDASRTRKLMAWGVHAYTGLGLPLAFVAAAALHERNASLFFLTLCLAIFVDATDGAMARAVKVKEVLPTFSGRRLDDLIDFLTFAFLPALALPALGLLPEGFAWIAVAPLAASGYGFCQENAKTDDAFVGFPSYWNIVVGYLYVLGGGVWLNAAVIVTLSILVFVPVHYVYPTRTRMLRPLTLLLGGIWGGAMVALSAMPDAEWARSLAMASLAYPAYYVVISVVHHMRVHADPERPRRRWRRR